MKRALTLCLAAGVLGVSTPALIGCQSGKKEPPAERPVDYRFDADDARRIYSWMVEDCLAQPWLDRWETTALGELPAVLVGRVRNDTEDYIDTRLFTKRIEEELINSRRVKMLADPQQRQDLEQVATSQLSDAEVLDRGRELEADYVMVGWVGDHKARGRDGRTIVAYYLVSLDLISVETGEKVWTNTEEIEKSISRR